MNKGVYEAKNRLNIILQLLISLLVHAILISTWIIYIPEPDEIVTTVTVTIAAEVASLELEKPDDTIVSDNQPDDDKVTSVADSASGPPLCDELHEMPDHL